MTDKQILINLLKKRNIDFYDMDNLSESDFNRLWDDHCIVIENVDNGYSCVFYFDITKKLIKCQIE